MPYLKTHPYFFLFLLLFILFNDRDGVQAKSEKAIEIVSFGNNSITVALTFPGWSFEKSRVGDEEFVRAEFEGAYFQDEALGAPRIPYHVLVIGVPVGAVVQGRILSADDEVLSDVKVIPHFGVARGEIGPEASYVLDTEIYENTALFPASQIKSSARSFFRDQQIVRVAVAGLQFLPSKNQIRKYDRIVLQLDFVGGETQPSVGRIRSRHEEELYENAILNYRQALNWRKSRSEKAGIPKSRSQMNGTFYTFGIREEGMYKIDGAFLEANLNGMSLAQIDPRKIRLFNNGGRELPRDMNAIRPQGFIENAIIVEDGGDGTFDRDDFILFYGIGIEGWDYNPGSGTFSHYINHYGFNNIYWLSFDQQQDGKRIPQVSSGQISGNPVDTYQGLLFIEEERFNPLKSGLNWFGREFAIDDISRSHTFNLELPNATGNATLEASFISKVSGLHQFSFQMNGASIGDHQFFGSSPFLGQYLRMQASTVSVDASAALIAGSNQLQISYAHPTSTGRALLDWLELTYAASLQVVDDELAFTVTPASGLQSYRVGGFSSNAMKLFDVSDFSRVREIVNFTATNNVLTFADVQETSKPKRYLTLVPSKYKTIENIERMEVLDLRDPSLAAEFIIITHEDFYSEALRLESLRENGNPDNRLVTEVVRITDIYNNFSGGVKDPVAIRDFIKYAFENWPSPPSYVLLFGDGDYDYKDAASPDFIPTFQTDELPRDNRLAELVSRTTDSWYTYVSGNDQVMDLAIGRINAQTLQDAQSAIDKIIAYETHPLRGNWRNTITMVGDDELVGGGRPSAADDVHIRQTETIAESAFPNCFDVQKIYLTEFPKVLNASQGGVIKPAARETLIRQINQGTLIVNFIGHGNSTVWAHEVVFHQSDNERVQNTDKLIFFVAATCDWALFDAPERQSQAEELLLAENRGAIAILSSARLVFSSGNFAFNRSYYDNLFTVPGQTGRIGDAFVATRIRTGNTTNDEKFHIYGDPTLRLAIPKQEAVITAITPDSVVALTTMEIAGEVRKGGQLQDDFNGKAFLTTFDSKRFVENIPEAGSVQRYFLPGNSIFRGAVPVQNGRFTVRFIVPKDISYGGSLARVSAYFWNDEIDGSGCRDHIQVSSTSAELTDNTGPEIQIYFKGHENFTTGDIIDENVTMVVDIADTVSGINIAGEIGHRLTLNIDPNEETCLSELNRFRGISMVDLTDIFQFKEGDHLRGTVALPLNFPSEVDIAGRTVSCVGLDGQDRHTLVIKAWDNANNSSTVSVEIRVVHQQGLVLTEIMNYPNPFPQNTTFTFISNRDAEIRIKIFTVSGQLIRTLEYPLAASGFNMIEWDGRDAVGDFPANGVYLYKVVARTQDESGEIQIESPIQRLAIIR
ncbi:MAG: type IX secretion system sortase PorU [bacterium]